MNRQHKKPFRSRTSLCTPVCRANPLWVWSTTRYCKVS
jgi:hypothetical protein